MPAHRFNVDLCLANTKFFSLFSIIATISLLLSGCRVEEGQQSGGPIKIEFLKSEPGEALALRIRPCSSRDLNKFKAQKGRVVLIDLLIRKNGKPHVHCEIPKSKIIEGFVHQLYVKDPESESEWSVAVELPSGLSMTDPNITYKTISNRIKFDPLDISSVAIGQPAMQSTRRDWEVDYYHDHMMLGGHRLDFPISNNQLLEILGGFPRHASGKRVSLGTLQYQIWDEYGIYATLIHNAVQEIVFQLRRPSINEFSSIVPKLRFGGTLKFNGETVNQGLAEPDWKVLKFPEWTTSPLVRDKTKKDKQYIREPETAWANPEFRKIGGLESVAYKNRTQLQLDNDPIDTTGSEIDFYRDHILLNGKRLDFPIRKNELENVLGRPRGNSTYLTWDQYGCFAKEKRERGKLIIEQLTFQLRRYAGTCKFRGQLINRDLTEENWTELKFPDWMTSAFIAKRSGRGQRPRRYTRKPEQAWVHPQFSNNGDLVSLRYQLRTRQQVENDPIDCSDWEFDFYDDHVLFNGQRLEFPIKTSKLIDLAGKPTGRRGGKTNVNLTWGRHGFFAQSDVPSGQVTEITFQLQRVNKKYYPREFFGGTIKLGGITIDKDLKKEDWELLEFPDWVNSDFESNQDLDSSLVRPEFIYRDKQLGSVTFRIKSGGR